MTDPALRSLQQAELEILDAFIRVCERHGLRYYLGYGTLLGAVRHAGFIPWDDDIDVVMPRPDFHRLNEISRDELEPQYTWHTYRTMPGYGILGRIVGAGQDARQTEPGRHREPVAFLDVFPLDGTPSISVLRLGRRIAIRLCTYRLYAGFGDRGPIRRIVDRLIRIIPRWMAVRTIDAIAAAFPFDRSRFVHSPGGRYSYTRESWPLRYFGDGVVQTFEGRPARGPDEWHAYLTDLYGDYRVIPPESERLQHFGRPD